jgi:hypothetical protein
MQQKIETVIEPRILTDKELADFSQRFMEERGFLPLTFQQELTKRFASRTN